MWCQSWCGAETEEFGGSWSENRALYTWSCDLDSFRISFMFTEGTWFTGSEVLTHYCWSVWFWVLYWFKCQSTALLFYFITSYCFSLRLCLPVHAGSGGRSESLVSGWVCFLSRSVVLFLSGVETWSLTVTQMLSYQSVQSESRNNNGVVILSEHCR